MTECYYKVPAIHEYQEIEEEPKEDTVFEDTVVCSLCGKEVLLTDATFDTRGSVTCRDCQKDIEEGTFLDSREPEAKEPVKEAEKEKEPIEKEPKRELISIRPDIPPSISYVGQYLKDEDMYWIKTDKPIPALEKELTKERIITKESQIESLRKSAPVEAEALDRLKVSFARGRG